MKQTPDIERLLSRAADAPLTDAERTRMRAYVREYAAHLPVREGARATSERTLTNAFLALVTRPARFSAAIAVLLIASSGAVAYAAEGTLPGDALYGVKVSVNEPIRLALATEPEEKASLHMAFAERRIDEAAALAAKGELTAPTEAKLAAEFNANAEQAAQIDTDPAVRAVSAASFADRLTAYEYVLRAADRSSGGATAALRSSIGAQIALLAPEDASADAPVHATALALSVQAPNTAAPKAKMAARADASTQHLATAADAALMSTAGTLSAASSTLGATTSALARTRLDRAAALATEGRTLLANHDEAGATDAFKASLSASTQLEVLTHAAVKLKINAFSDDASATAATTTATSSASSTDAEEEGGVY